MSEPIAVTTPETGFASLAASASSARPMARRGIFFDVENSSRPEHVRAVLDHLGLDWSLRTTDLVAIGNWRVVSHETARILANHGAQLVHSAPAIGIRDWSDLRIAVAAGAWLAAGRPGDSIEIISDDQAFDAVGDVAASLGVRYHRLSFRALAERGLSEPVSPAVAAARPHAGARRGRRRRGRGTGPRPPSPAPPPRAVAEAAGPRPVASRPAVLAARPVASHPEAEPHTAPADEIKHVVEELLATSPGGVTLDAVGNALKDRGFRRTSGSPRLITRLRRLKSLEVTPRGIVRLVEAHRHPEPHPHAEPMFEAGASAEDGAGAAESRTVEAASTEDHAANGAPGAEEQPVVDVPKVGGEAQAAPWRRRRRRGGRRWRGRGQASTQRVAVAEARGPDPS